MNEEITNRYIKFGIDNGYKDKDNFRQYIHIDGSHYECVDKNYLEIITSKEFIEAVARGFVRQENPEIHKDFKKQDLVNYEFPEKVNKITIDQAIAIRDGKLEDFILGITK